MSTYECEKSAVVVRSYALIGLALFASWVLDDLGPMLQDTRFRPCASIEERSECFLGDLKCFRDEVDELVAELLHLLEVAKIRLPEAR